MRIYGDTVDEPDGSITVTLQEWSLAPLPTGWSFGPSATYTIRDDDPTVVTLSRLSSNTGNLAEGGAKKAEFTVTLGRALIAGERIDVPLAISGSGITTADIEDLAKKAGAANTGVTVRNAGTLTPTVSFEGAGAQTATLEIAASLDGVTEHGHETMTVALASDSTFDADSDTNVGGGADPHATTRSFSVQIDDFVAPPAPPSTITVDALDLVMTEGDASDTARVRFRLGRRLTAGEIAKFHIGIGRGGTGGGMASNIRTTDHAVPDYGYTITGTGVTWADHPTEGSLLPVVTMTGHDTNVVQEVLVTLAPISGRGDGNTKDGALVVQYSSRASGNKVPIVYPSKNGHIVRHREVPDLEPETTVSFSANTYSVTEGRTVQAELVLSRAAQRDLTVRVVDGSLSASDRGRDYVSGPWDVTIPAGTTRKRFGVRTVADDVSEGGETFSLSITTIGFPSWLSAASPSSATVTINEYGSTSPPALTLVVDGVSRVRNEGGHADFAVVRRGTGEGQVKYNLDFSGSVSTGVDYRVQQWTYRGGVGRWVDMDRCMSGLAGALAANEYRHRYRIRMLNDAWREPGETLNAVLSSTRVLKGRETFTITANDAGGRPQPTQWTASFARAASSVDEDAGTVRVRVELTAPEGACGARRPEHLLVEFGGNAARGDDYTLHGGRTNDWRREGNSAGNLPADRRWYPIEGDSVEIPVRIVNDAIEDGGETVVLTILDNNEPVRSHTPGYAIGRAVHTITINNDEGGGDTPAQEETPAAAFAPDAALVAEVEALAEKHRDSNPDAHERLTKVLKGMKGEDGGYTADECRAESRKFGASVEKRWTPWCDEIARREAHEANAKQQPPPPPPVPEISIAAGAGVTEGTDASFTLTATPAPAAPLTVDVTVTEAGGYATAGAQQVTIPASGTATLTIATTGDDVDEPDGSVTAALAAGQGYTVSANAGAATVAVADDDDPAPAAFVPDAALVAEVEALAARLKGSNPSAHARVMKVLMGLKGEDGGYTAAECRAESRKHGAGVEQRWKPWCDEIARREAHGTTTVQPAPTPPVEPEISIAGGAGVTEGGDASFTLTADPAPAADLAVAVTVSEKAGSDHVAAAQEGSRTVTIPAGQAQAAFTVATVDDTADEQDGSVTATLGTGAGYTLAASPGDAATVAVADNDAAAALSFSIDDATAREDAGHIRFTVRLSKPAARVVYARFSTREADPVSARQGVDYKGWTGGFVVIPRGGTEATIPIRIFNDNHDEGSETFEVVLSGPGGAAIADGVAVGTIVNADPLPAAWLARFGRTVAEQALEGISGRMAADRTPGMQGSLGGQAIGFAPSADIPETGAAAPGNGAAGNAAANGAALRAMADIARNLDGGNGSLAGSGSSAGSGDRFGAAGAGWGFDNPQAGHSQTMTARELLLGSSFSLTGERDSSGGTLAFWGRAAHGSFDGREGKVSLDGEVTTGMLGADYARGRWLLGLALTQSTGEGGYRADMPPPPVGSAPASAGGKVKSSLTAAIPYAALQASERLKLWGALGYGTGEVTLTPDSPETGGDDAKPETLKADTDWTMAALGMRGDVLQPPADGSGGPALALVSDALWARTASDKVTGLAASESDVTRLRLGLEGSWQVALEGGGSLTPRLELGARHDGGDAETGFGVEFGGGLAWTDPRLGLSLDIAGRTLLAHEDGDLKDRGFSASLAYDPDPASERGLSLSLRQDMGGPAEGGLDALFANDPLADRTGSEATGRWAAEAAYGFPVFGDRFTGSPHAGFGMSAGARDYSVGWRLTPGANAPDLSFGVRATRSESDTAAPAEHRIGFEAVARW